MWILKELSRIVHSAKNQQLALKAAREGIVLLKNEKKLLPLGKNLGSIAVIGPNASNRCEFAWGLYT